MLGYRQWALRPMAVDDPRPRSDGFALVRRGAPLMTSPDTAQGHRTWRQAALAFLQPPVIRMLFLGFSAGLPILLIFSTLSVWLREAGVDRSTVTFFSWAALGAC